MATSRLIVCSVYCFGTKTVTKGRANNREELVNTLRYAPSMFPVRHDSTLGDAPIKVQQDRKKLAEGHFNISTTKRVSLENSTDLGRGAAPELKSVEFLSETLFVVE